jgi:membrane protease YdiL (CAAX protease family)
METKETARDAKRFALIALSVYVLFEAVTFPLHILRRRIPFLEGFPAIPLAVVFFSWVVPLLIVYKVEKKDRASLGLTIGREKYPSYALYAIIALILPAFFTGLDKGLVVEFIDQIVWIGLPEEAFSRGYLMTRLCNWLGDRKGLFLNGFLFGLGHITSLVSQHGFKYPLDDAFVGFSTFLGGLMFGYMYLKAKNIVPPALVHVAANMYLSRIIGLLG